MRQETTNIYKFNELTEEAQQHALDSNRDYDTEIFSDIIDLEYYREKLAEIGFTDAEIQYSGFFSQGDGASFTSDVDLHKIVSYLIYNSTGYADTVKFYKLLVLHEKQCIDLSLWVERGAPHYVHENTCNTHLEVNLYQENRSGASEDWFNDTADMLKEAVEDIRHEVCQSIYYALRKEYEYMQSDEYLRDTFEANDMEFTSNGTIF